MAGCGGGGAVTRLLDEDAASSVVVVESMPAERGHVGEEEEEEAGESWEGEEGEEVLQRVAGSKSAEATPAPGAMRPHVRRANGKSAIKCKQAPKRQTTAGVRVKRSVCGGGGDDDDKRQ